MLLALAGLGTLAASVAVSLVVLDGGREAAACPTNIDPEATMHIEAPSTIAAGDPLTVRVSLDEGSTVKHASVSLLRADGPVVRSVELRGGYGAASFGPSVTGAAGHLRLFAAACGAEASQALHVRPGPAVAPIEVLVGPRRIPADETSVASVLTIPTDRLGNPVADGTDVSYALRRPDGRLENASVDTERLLGVVEVRAGSVSGATTVAARVGTARGAAAELVEEPGAPTSGFALVLDHLDAAGALGETPAVHIDGLRDRFGNLIADGALVSVVVAGGGIDGAQVQGTLIGGSARIPLPPVDRSGVLTVQAFIDGVGSEVLRHVVPPSESERAAIPLTAEADPAEAALVITVGPVLDDLEAYASDGTIATIDVVGPKGSITRERLALVDGMATRRLHAPEPGVYHVHVSTIFGSSAAEAVLP
jgi:hypothetical protein